MTRLAPVGDDSRYPKKEMKMTTGQHPAKTLLGDRVLYYRKGSDKGHVAFVIETHDDPHKACLVFYCPESKGWHEAHEVQFGKAEGCDYFVNAEG